MIDLGNETTLSLTQAICDPLFPPGRNGARPSFSCIMRWVLDGVKGPTGERVRLEAVRLGGRWVTSREAIQRFADRLTPRLEAESPPLPRPAGKRRRSNDRAAKKLEQLGLENAVLECPGLKGTASPPAGRPSPPAKERANIVS